MLIQFDNVKKKRKKGQHLIIFKIKCHFFYEEAFSQFVRR